MSMKIQGSSILLTFTIVFAALAIEEIAGAKTCSDINCEKDEHCDMDLASNTPKCVCNELCKNNYRPVCGSDNKTYRQVYRPSVI